MGRILISTSVSSDSSNTKMEQIRTIKEEFGGNDDEYDDVAALQRKMQNAGKPPNFQKHASRELRCVVFEL
ncbi:hypothetical protein Tco_0470915 [Tanacetum coccineum]